MVLRPDARPSTSDGSQIVTGIPVPYDRLVARLSEYVESRYIAEHLGDGTSGVDRRKAARILLNGGVIGSFIGDKVGGILANPFCPGAVDAVIELKSKGGTPRHPLFPLVAHADTLPPFIDVSHMGAYALGDLTGRGFFQYPATPEALATFEQRFFSYDGQTPIIQFFIPEVGSLLDQLLDIVDGDLPVPTLLGTSANFTGAGSIKDPDTAALFGLATDIYWLYGHEESTLSGSYPIQRFDNGRLISVR